MRLPSLAIRSSMLVAAVALVAGLPSLALPAQAAASAAPTIAAGPSPAFALDAPDPFVLRVGSTYYAYTTGTTWGNHIGVLTSTNPASGWHTTTGHSYGSTALGPLPAWQQVNTQTSPGVFFWGGRYVMYYDAMDTASGHFCLSVATSVSPAGPFLDSSSGPTLCQSDRGGSVDPSPMVDAGGHAWLYWKSNDGSSSAPAYLWVAPLNASGLGFAAFGQIVLSQDTVAHPWETTIENPAMILVGGTYELWFSGGVWTSGGYAQGYAVCAGPTGPCDQPQAGPVLGSYGSVAGPGGGALFTDGAGAWWLVYDAWTSPCTSYSCGGARALYTARVTLPGSAAPPKPAPAATCPVPAKRTGYRLVASDGGIFSYGNLPFCGSTGGISLNRPIVGTAATGSGAGYWLVASDGGIFSFGDARFFGSTGGTALNRPIVAMATTPTGRGYWLVASDGGIFSFGDARFNGSTGGAAGNAAIVAMATTPTGHGYWLARADGAVFAFGDAKALGSGRPGAALIGMVASADGGGYLLVGADGHVAAFGDEAMQGDTSGAHLNRPMVAVGRA
jgi:hypothetical protein